MPPQMEIWISTILCGEELPDGTVRIAGPLEVVVGGPDEAVTRQAFHLDYSTDEVDPENLRGTLWVKRGEETILYLGDVCFNEDPNRVLAPETGFRCDFFGKLLALSCRNNLEPSAIKLDIQILNEQQMRWLFSLLRTAPLQ